MASYLYEYSAMTIGQEFGINPGEAEGNYGVAILLDIIQQLNAARLGASQLNEDVLLYTIDMALSEARTVLTRSRLGVS
jgi:hypothetical protein